MKILVFGVIYPGVERFLEDYFNCLNFQLYKDFEILIIEDDLKLSDQYYRDNLTIKKSLKGSTPADIRNYAIGYGKKNDYDIIIFTDCDDYFSKNRIKNTKIILEKADFCVNRLTPVSVFGKTIRGISTVPIRSHININDILKANYFGMSNTGLKLNSLPNAFCIPSDIIAVDWWLFTLLLLYNKQYIYDENSVTYYRQHENNLVGLRSNLNENNAILGIETKLIHYKKLLEYCEMNGLHDYLSLFEELILDFNELYLKIQRKEFIRDYVLIINNHIDKIKTGWWSEILTLEEWNKYV